MVISLVLNTHPRIFTYNMFIIGVDPYSYILVIYLHIITATIWKFSCFPHMAWQTLLVTLLAPHFWGANEIAIFATAMVQVKSSNDAFEKQISQHKTWQGHVATLDAGWFGFEDLWVGSEGFPQRWRSRQVGGFMGAWSRLYRYYAKPVDLVSSSCLDADFKTDVPTCMS